MPKPLAILRPSRLETSLPEDLRARLDLHLFSEVEGRVPQGAYQRLIVSLLRDYLEVKRQTLDLSELSGVVPGGYEIQGTPQSIAQLKALFNK